MFIQGLSRGYAENFLHRLRPEGSQQKFDDLPMSYDLAFPNSYGTADGLHRHVKGVSDVWHRECGG